MSALLLSLLASLSLSPVLALSCQPGWATTGNENLGCLKIYPEETTTWMDAVLFCKQENITNAASGPRLLEAARS